MATINDNRFLGILPGMLASAETLVIKIQSEQEEGVPTEATFGVMASASIMSAHCAELLLKYKIQQEGKTITKTHDLLKLFNRLNADSQASIETEFDKAISPPGTMPDGWDSAKSVFKKTRDASVAWRYAVESRRRITLTFPLMIYAAALSVKNAIANQLTESMREPRIPSILSEAYKQLK